MSRAGLVMLVFAVSALAVGCGSSGDSDTGESGQAQEEQVRSVGQEFYASLLDGNYEEACSLFTNGARKQIERLASGSEELRGSSCEQILGLVTGASGREMLKKQVGDVDEWQVKVNGDSATITPPDGGEASATEMVKVDGEWRIGAQPTGSG